MSSSNSNEVWCGLDMHVHTPASDDYKGNKDEKEYLRIIQGASRQRDPDSTQDSDADKSIKVIAISDHNSVDGYRYLISKKEDTLRLVEGLKSRGLPVDEELQKEATAFSNVHVLMGVEVKAYPGVHIQLIFKESVSHESVISFLEDGAAAAYDTFKGNPDTALRWRIDELFDEAIKTFSDSVFIVAPHADRTNGILEVLKGSAQAKMDALRHPALKCIGFNSAETREYLQNNIFTKPEYRRDEPVSFIQASDFHGEHGFDIGHVHTRINLENSKVSFDNIVNCLKNPCNIKCSIDFVKDTYNELTEGYTLKSFKSYIQNKLVVSSDDSRDICDIVCGYLNTSGGIIEIIGNITSALAKSEVIEECRESLLRTLNSRLQPEITTLRTTYLQLSTTKVSVLCLFPRSNTLHMSDGKVLVIKSNSPCPAHSHEIESIVARNLSIMYGKQSEANLEMLAFEARKLSRTQQAIPISVKLQRSLDTVPTGRLKFKMIEQSSPMEELDKLIENNCLGHPDGNVALVPETQAPRLSESYLRFSATRYVFNDTESLEALESNSIVLAPEGGSYYVKEGTSVYIKNFSVVLSPNMNEEILLFLAWFKSSIFMWYCITILGSFDLLFLFLQRAPLVFPTKAVFEGIKTELLSLVNNILLEEKKIVDKYKKISSKPNYADAINKEIDKHNAYINNKNLEIDYLFLKTFHFNKKEALFVYKTLGDLNMCNLGALENQDFLQRLVDLDKSITCQY